MLQSQGTKVPTNRATQHCPACVCMQDVVQAPKSVETCPSAHYIHAACCTQEKGVARHLVVPRVPCRWHYVCQCVLCMLCALCTLGHASGHPRNQTLTPQAFYYTQHVACCANLTAMHATKGLCREAFWAMGTGRGEIPHA